MSQDDSIHFSQFLSDAFFPPFSPVLNFWSHISDSQLPLLVQWFILLTFTILSFYFVPFLLLFLVLNYWLFIFFVTFHPRSSVFTFQLFIRDHFHNFQSHPPAFFFPSSFLSSIFSVTRRSRSDVSQLVSHS